MAEIVGTFVVRDVIALPGGLRTNHFDYDPYGNPTTTLGSALTATDFRYAGLVYHPPSGLYLATHRAYDPTIGRWLSRDPIGEQGGLNLYAYVGNDPVSAVDPLGLATVTYNGSTNTLTVETEDATSHSFQSFPSYNNTDSHSQGPIQDGTYPYIEHVIHPDDAPNSPYGSNGGFKFDAPGRTNIEVHSGRQSIPDGRGRIGPQHATMGCIRTNDAGTDAINGAVQNGDPPTTLTVTH